MEALTSAPWRPGQLGSLGSLGSLAAQALELMSQRRHARYVAMGRGEGERHSGEAFDAKAYVLAIVLDYSSKGGVRC